MKPANIQALILDMDGVLWIENQPLGDLAEIFTIFKRKKLKVCLATNNSTRTPGQYNERLCQMGVTNLGLHQIVTSSQTLAHMLSKRFPKRGKVYTIGESGLRHALEEQGFSNAEESQVQEVVAVAVGMDRNISFSKLRCATLLIRRGIPFFATNPDRTFPTPEGMIPGAGSLIAALIASTDVQPLITGKPSPHMIELALERLSASPKESMVVGDRLDTDISAGQAAGCKTALVLSGVTSREEGEAWRPSPDLIVEDLKDLLSKLG